MRSSYPVAAFNVLVCGLLACGVFTSRPAWPAELGKPIDLKIASGVVSIVTRPNGRGFVAAFSHCKIAYLDLDAVLGSQQDVTGCKRLFTVHEGQFAGAEAVTASAYTGHAVVLSNGQILRYKTNNAAVTDVFLAFGGLLASSDDGSITFSDLDGHAAPQILATGQGVARVMLPDRSTASAAPAFFVAFDSGRVLAVTNSLTRAFEPGVGRINGLALTLDRASLYVAGFDGRVRRIDLASGSAQDVFSAGADINAIDLDDATSRLGIVSDNGRFVVIETSSGKKILDMKVADVALTAVALAAGGGRALVGDAAGLLYRLDLPGAALQR